MTYHVYKTLGGRRYAYEYESYYDQKLGRSRQRMVRYLGPCDKEGAIIAEPKIGIEAVYSAFPVGPLAVLYAAAKDLHIQDNVASVISKGPAKLLLCIALNQATARVPIYRLPEWVVASPLPKWEGIEAQSLTVRNFEEALSTLCHLTPQKTWENKGYLLQKILTKAWRGTSREPAGAYYDITKQSYYGTHCPYGQLGHDEDGGTSLVVGFGMVISKEHRHPIICQTLPGGQNDSLSVVSVLEMLRGQDLHNLTMVMDKGMTSKDNVRTIVNAGYHLVGSIKGWSKETVAYASRWQGEELELTQNVVGTSHGNAVYAKAFTAPFMGFPKMRIAVVENISRKAEDRKARDLLLKELDGPLSKDRLKEIKKELGTVIVSTKGRRGFEVDEGAVKIERALDGRFLLFSTNLSLDGQEMYKTYFAKDAIEKVFRTSKGDLSLGPVRYRRKDRLDAYATVVYMAYLLWSWAERRLQKKYQSMHLSEAMRVVENVSWVRFGAGKSVREWTTRLTTKQEEILSAVGAPTY